MQKAHLQLKSMRGGPSMHGRAEQRAEHAQRAKHARAHICKPVWKVNESHLWFSYYTFLGGKIKMRNLFITFGNTLLQKTLLNCFFRQNTNINFYNSPNNNQEEFIKTFKTESEGNCESASDAFNCFSLLVSAVNGLLTHIFLVFNWMEIFI